MKNRDYWEFMSKLIDVYGDRSFRFSSPREGLMSARERFEHGIALIMSEEKIVGKGYLRDAKKIIEEYKQYNEAEDLIIYYILNWLISGEDRKEILQQAGFLMSLELYHQVIQSGDSVLVERFRAVGLKEAGEIPPHLPDEDGDKYVFETIGDDMIRLARVKFLLGEYSICNSLAEGGMKLYRIALKKITEMMVEENPLWADKEGKPLRELLVHIPVMEEWADEKQEEKSSPGEDASFLKMWLKKKEREEEYGPINTPQKGNIMQGFTPSRVKKPENSHLPMDGAVQGLEMVPLQAREYTQRWLELAGNIPMFQNQARILRETAKCLSGQGANAKSASQMMDNFFNQIVNPPHKKESLMTLQEEIQWVLLRDKFLRYQFGSASSLSPEQLLINNLG